MRGDDSSAPRSDAYLRLQADYSPLHSSVADIPGSLVMIDIETSDRGMEAEDLTWMTKLVAQAPAGFFLRAGSVLVRWPNSLMDVPDDEVLKHTEGLSSHFSKLSGRKIPAGIIRFPLGASPRVVWSSENTFDDEAEMQLLARARAAELGFLLRDGRGIWQPKAYHYKMPSGEHSNTFIRLANAIQRPRDAVALATWLHVHCAERLRVVMDSSTVTPLVLALQLAVEGTEGEFGIGRVVSISDYPDSAFEVEHAVSAVAGEDRILGLLSVTSTGRSSFLLADALRHAGTDYVLEVLVSRAGHTAVALPLGERGGEGDGEVERAGSVRAPWLGLSDDSARYRSEAECRLCANPATARLVYIDPKNFETLALTKPDPMTPSISAALDARPLWECYDAVDGIGVNCRPHGSTATARGNRKLLGVRCLPNRVIDPANYPADGRPTHARFLELVEERAGLANARFAEGNASAGGGPYCPGEAQLVVVTSEDREADGFDEFLAALAKGCGRDDPWPDDDILPIPYPLQSIQQEFRPRFEGASNILVVTLGAVTGSTMQRLLVAVHDVIASGPDGRSEPDVAGIVMHARPEEQREWKVLTNAFTHLEALWITHLPLWSPFDSEHEVLAVTRTHHPFIESRKRYLSLDPEWSSRITDAPLDPYATFWGMPLELGSDGKSRGKEAPRLRPGSRFGHKLRTTTTFAAVGAAMQHARLHYQPRGAPLWQQFEMPAILRSYFDPPIVASILRWLEPHEAWWGEREEDAEYALAEAWARATDADKKLLLPEFLLAAAEGKVAKRGVGWLKVTATDVVQKSEQGQELEDNSPPWTEEECAPVGAGLVMLKDFSEPSPT